MMPQSPPSGKSRFISGFHAVKEALLSGHPKITEIWIKEGRGGIRVQEVLEAAIKRSVPVIFRAAEEMDRVLPGLPHQGIMALAEFSYSALDEVIDLGGKSPGEALIVAADHITDEGNLGALVRTAAFFGAYGLLLPKDRSASVSARIMKSSAGALAHMPVARVVNLARALDLLRKKGFWIIGAAGESAHSIFSI